MRIMISLMLFFSINSLAQATIFKCPETDTILVRTLEPLKIDIPTDWYINYQNFDDGDKEITPQFNFVRTLHNTNNQLGICSYIIGETVYSKIEIKPARSVQVDDLHRRAGWQENYRQLELQCGPEKTLEECEIKNEEKQ